eukprot:3171202-Prymnesium_polylepis.1
MPLIHERRGHPGTFLGAACPDGTCPQPAGARVRTNLRRDRLPRGHRTPMGCLVWGVPVRSRLVVPDPWT